MVKIKEIGAKRILNSKGNPTIETTVVLTSGIKGVASVPSGTSVGKYEAVELKDTSKVIENIKKLVAPHLLGLGVNKQQEIDKKLIKLDNTKNKRHLGANSILSISIAIAKAAAQSSSVPLFLYLKNLIAGRKLTLKIPTPCFNLINGGKHGNGNLDFQEFFIIPSPSMLYKDTLNTCLLIYNHLGKILKSRSLPLTTGAEGGFAPNLKTNAKALFLLRQSVEELGIKIGVDVFFGLDCAASSFYKNGKYYIKDRIKSLSSEDLTVYYQDILQDFPILYLEDPFAEDDWNGWANFPSKVKEVPLIVGDDLTTTNPSRLRKALDKKAISGIVIKPNQIGTVSEAIAIVDMAKHNGLKIIVSHRSGETNDDFIADFAVAVGADYVKFGAIIQKERIAKYDRLLQIEKQIKAL